jgi:hypothetical protein
MAQSIEAFGVGTEKGITKESLYKDAIVKSIESNGIKYKDKKDLIDNYILNDSKRFIESSKILKFNKLAGFYSLKAVVDVRDQFLIQQIKQLSKEEVKPKKEIKIHRGSKKEEERVIALVEGLGVTIDDAKNDAKAIAYELYAEKYDISGSNLDHDIPTYKQTKKIIISTFDILSEIKIRDGLSRVDISVVVEEEKKEPEPTVDDEESKKMVDELVENKELIQDIDKSREESKNEK